MYMSLQIVQCCFVRVLLIIFVYLVTLFDNYHFFIYFLKCSQFTIILVSGVQHSDSIFL